jgi:trk system potassium uptake protein TrkH
MRLFPATDETHLRHAMMIAALGWASVSIIGALPFWLIASHPNAVAHTGDSTLVLRYPWNALFESVSGFTSTGLSLVLRPSELPYSLQWWRSFSEWIGGVGVIVLMLSVVQNVPGLYRLYYSEGREDKLFPSVGSTVRTIWWIYLLYTTLGVLLLRLAGMPWWHALNHGMTGIATGGFSINENSIGGYGTAAQLATILIMLMGAISFGIHYRVLTQRSLTALWNDAQHRLLMGFLVIGGTLLLLENYLITSGWMWVDTAFQWVSALSTCGFSTVDLQPWSPAALLLLTLAMMSGGAAGSTVGGIKLSRLVLLYKGIQWRFQQINLRPHQLMRHQIDGKVISEGQAFARVESAAVMLLLWLIVTLFAVVVLMHSAPMQYSAGSVLFEVVSALSNVGLSVGITHPDLSLLGKFTLMLCMWMGRLEIVPVALFISLFLGNSRQIS